MNILVTCDRLDCMGGLEEHVSAHVKYLLNKGHNVHLDCNAISLHYCNMLEHENFTLSSPWSENWSDVLKDINGFVPDIVHAHPFSAITRGHAVHRHFNVPLIYTIHGEYAYTMPYSHETSRIILVNDKIIDRYRQFNYEVIQNGIDTNVFCNRNYVKENLNKKTVTIISRLQDNKEQPIIQFIEACKYFDENISIRIVGGGSYFDKILNLTKNNNYKCKFEMVGSSTNVADEINKSDLVCGCDRVALEALCCSKPVFYLGQGHMKDLITYNSYKDFLFTNKGKIVYTDKVLAENIMDILNNIKVEEELVNEIRNNYNLETQIKKIEKIYIESIK